MTLKSEAPFVTFSFPQVLHPSSDFYRMIQLGQNQKLLQLIREEKLSVRAISESSGRDLLSFAIDFGQLQVCQVLVGYGADPLESYRAQGAQ
jgi:hypothetical protein